MFKSTLGLGLGSTKKADLTAYLKNLEKKNKEVQRKHSVTGTEDVNVAAEEISAKGESSQEDSDLLSLAREMQEEQYESPFIKKRTEAKLKNLLQGRHHRHSLSDAFCRPRCQEG